MRRSLSLALLMLTALVWAGTAHAKELSSFKACGLSGCREVRDAALLRPLLRAVEAQGEPVSTRTPVPARFLRFEFSIKGDGASPSFVQYYVPSVGSVALESNPGTWTWVKAGALRPVFARVTKGVVPFATPKIARVEVGGKPARDPGSYRRLFLLSEPTDAYPDDGDWRTIRVTTKSPSPWSTSAATLEYSPSTDALWRGSQFVRVPPALAARLEAGKSLSGGGGEGSFPWAALLGVGAAAVVVPATLLVRRRRTS
jgi:hypothetical protein